MNKTFTIAFIGGDGAGKTTITQKLLDSSVLPFKYLYMGMSPRSNSHALLSSKISHKLKFYLFKRNFMQHKKIDERNIQKFYENNRGKDNRGKILATLRLFNRIAEECFRHFLSLKYKFQGYVVIYDRHFVFDFAPTPNDFSENQNRMSERFHRWFLNYVYPKPDITFFLDASSKVLYDRKGEASLEYLNGKREAYLVRGSSMKNFIIVDVSKSFDQVFLEIKGQILNYFYTGKIEGVNKNFLNPEKEK